MPSLPRSKRPAYRPKHSKPGNKGVNAKFYNSGNWRKLSERIRHEATIRNHGIGCEVCNQCGGFGTADVTDHIIPIRAGGAATNERNLWALCNDHHNSKTAYERHGLNVQVLRATDGLIPADRSQVVNLLVDGRKGTGEG